jgi:hypothetical protein
VVIEKERRAALGHGESSGVRTSIECWGAAMDEESGTCVRLVASSLRSGGFFFGGVLGVLDICE